MNPTVIRPWYRLHRTTWVVSAIVAAAIVWAQVESGSCVMSYAVVFGWPTHAFYDMASGNSHTPLFDIRPLGLMVNLAAFLTLVTSTIVACERWRRRNLATWQFSLQSYFVVVTAVTVVAVLYHNEERLYEALPSTINGDLSPFNCLHYQPLLAVAPILFAGFCTVMCVLLIPELLVRRQK